MIRSFPSQLLLLALTTGLTVTSCKTPATTNKGKTAAASTGNRNEAGLPAPTWNQPGQGGLPTSVGTRESYSKVATNLPFIALTFDDGPHPVNTPRLLDMLRERNVKATFYVVGTNARAHPEILRRIISEGHEIGSHTISHGYMTKMTDNQIRDEMRGSSDIITAATGVVPRTFRPPYGAITSAQKSWIRAEFGTPAIMWSVDPEDWKRPGSSVVASRLVAGAAPGGILLVHDIHAPTIDAMPSALDQLLAKGFQFITVTQLIAMEARG